MCVKFVLCMCGSRILLAKSVKQVTQLLVSFLRLQRSRTVVSLRIVAADSPWNCLSGAEQNRGTP